jgi:Ca-activated chloride channel family protein
VTALTALALGACGAGSDEDAGSADGSSDRTVAEEWAPMAEAVAAEGSGAPLANPVVTTSEDPLSTFGLDVDTGSYTRAREFVLGGFLPDPVEVRTEEFVNYFEPGYEPPAEGLAVHVDGTTVPFLGGGGARVVRVGVQGATPADEARPDATLTFVIDVSGSMAEGGKLESAKAALRSLVGALRPTDRVGIVVYSDATREVLAHEPVAEAATILAVIDDLQPEGSTNAEAGLALGYEQARLRYDPERLNRVVLLSDGVANVGNTGPDAILATIGQAAGEGIDLVTVGFGAGDFQDQLMEQLADRGDGFYAYVDGPAEAERLFVHDLTGSLQVVAREARVQVAFDPAQVETYRLLGYENRAIADDDFRDDSVDGGEVGAGHSVTALYEVVLTEDATGAGEPLVTASVRYLDPETGEPVERTADLAGRDVAPSLEDAGARLQLSVLVAAYAESLRGGPWGDAISIDGVAANVEAVASRLDDPEVTELATLVAAAAELG